MLIYNYAVWLSILLVGYIAYKVSKKKKDWRWMGITLIPLIIFIVSPPFNLTQKEGFGSVERYNKKEVEIPDKIDYKRDTFEEKVEEDIKNYRQNREVMK